MNKNVMKVMSKISSVLTTNKTTILTGIAVTGVITTCVLAYRAGIKAHDVLKKRKEDLADVKASDTKAKAAVNKECAKTLIPLMLPSIVFGGVTVASILASHTASTKKIAVLSAAYSMSENALNELNGKMQDVLGEKKTRSIKDEILKDRLKENPSDMSKVIVTGDGDVLCMDSFSGRYLKTSANKIRQAFIVLSNDLQNEMYVTVNDFYNQIDLERIPKGDDFGWLYEDLERGLIPYDLSTFLTDDEVPCIVIDYNVHLI